jgi:uncharacterized protein (TIGR03382 family)
MQLQQRLRHVRAIGLVLGAILVLGRAAPAQARAMGFATASCDSCHRGGQIPKVTVTMTPEMLDPGATATVTVTITAVNGGPSGFYLHAHGQGTFQDIPGQGTRLPTATEIVHAAPKASVGGVVTFSAKWIAPAQAGAYSFEAWGVASNGNNQFTGDGASSMILPFTVGCSGMTVYVDFDGDGYGSDAIPPRKACDLQPGLVLKAGDCNDYRADVHPGAPEICDEYDNDCNGQINEGLATTMVYRDADGDGHGGRYTTDTKIGCGQAGYSSLHDDCNDTDKDVHPGAPEVCNNKDDNCNGRIDEGARLTCGTGWCLTVADTCTSTLCTPGTPRAEKCNLIDDDCDGVIDNDAPCDDGRVCVTGRCLMPDDARAVMEARVDGGADSDAGGGGGGAGGGGGHRGTPDAGGGSSERRQRSPGCELAGEAAPFGWPWLLLGLVLVTRRRR